MSPDISPNYAKRSFLYCGSSSVEMFVCVCVQTMWVTKFSRGDGGFMLRVLQSGRASDDDDERRIVEEV